MSYQSYQPVHDESNREAEIEMHQDANTTPTFPQPAIPGRPNPNPHSHSYNNSISGDPFSPTSNPYSPSPTSPDAAAQPTSISNPWNYQTLSYAPTVGYQPADQEGEETFHDEENELMTHKHSQSFDVDDHRSSIQFANATDFDARNSNPLRQSFASFGSGHSKDGSVRSFDTKRASRLLEHSKHLTKPVNRSYVGAVGVHVFVIAFCCICLGLRGDGSGFKMKISSKNLDLYQSGLNAVTGFIGTCIMTGLAALAEKAATHRIFERRHQDLTYMSDVLESWAGPFTSIKVLYDHGKERLRQRKMTTELALVMIYLILNALLSTMFGAVFTLGVYDGSKIATFPSIDGASVPLADQYEVMSNTLWQTVASSAFTTLQLQNTTIAGQRRNRLFQYADPTVNVSAGTASVEATDIIVQCGEVDDFDITMRIADLNTNGAQAWPTYVEIDPGSATRNLRYPDLAMYDTVPWFDCDHPYWNNENNFRTTHPSLHVQDGYGQEQGYVAMPLTYFIHYSCPNSPNLKDCGVYCQQLQDAKGNKAKSRPLYPAFSEQYRSTNNWNPLYNMSLTNQDDNNAPHILQDVGIEISLFACSFNATAAGKVDISLPSNKLVDQTFNQKRDNHTLETREWSTFTPPDSGWTHSNNNLNEVTMIFDPQGAPLAAGTGMTTKAEGLGCLFSLGRCHPGTAIEILLNQWLFNYGDDDNNDSAFGNFSTVNSNQLGRLEVLLGTISAAAFANAGAGSIETNTSLLYHQSIQQITFSIQLWPTIFGVAGSVVAILIAFLLLRPLPHGSPHIRGTSLIHITRLLAVSDIPEKMRASPWEDKKLRAFGRFDVAVDRGGSTLMSEKVLSASGSSVLPIITPSASAQDGLSFREKHFLTSPSFSEA